MYSTVDRIRAESWFSGNDDITDGYIEWYGNQANGVIKGFIGWVYNLTALNTNFTWSPWEQLLKRIEELLASSYLLIAEYGSEAKDTDKDWYKKGKQADELLQKIVGGELRLIDSNWSQFWSTTVSSAGGIELSLPTDNERIFKVNDIY